MSSLLGPVVPSFGALSGRLKFTVLRYNFNQDSLLHDSKITACEVLAGEGIKTAQRCCATPSPPRADSAPGCSFGFWGVCVSELRLFGVGSWVLGDRGSVSGFRVSSLGFRVSSFGFRVSSFGFRNLFLLRRRLNHLSLNDLSPSGNCTQS